MIQTANPMVVDGLASIVGVISPEAEKLYRVSVEIEEDAPRSWLQLIAAVLVVEKLSRSKRKKN
jgi:hypothetical protein